MLYRGEKTTNHGKIRCRESAVINGIGIILQRRSVEKRGMRFYQQRFIYSAAKWVQTEEWTDMSRQELSR